MGTVQSLGRFSCLNCQPLIHTHQVCLTGISPPGLTYHVRGEKNIRVQFDYETLEDYINTQNPERTMENF